MKTVHFIVNPIAGNGKLIITEHFLSNFFEKENFRIRVKYSDYKGHATILTRQSINEQAEIIVACGGDGTINEIASCLVNSKITLGIIPIGSGNGLARNLKIPKKLEKAILNLRNQKKTTIDVGRINGKYFFSNTGFGFAANAISNFENSNDRRLITYLKATFQSIWSFENNTKFTISMNGKQEVLFPFLVFVSNTNVMGYNFSITREAKLNDGLLDVVIIDHLNRLKMIYFALLFLLGLEHKIKEYNYYKIKCATIKIENQNLETPYQLDGELEKSKSGVLHLEVFKESLNVIGGQG